MLSPTHAALLRALFHATASARSTSRPALLPGLALEPAEAEAALEALERQALVDARTLRLTMAGLAVAVGLCGAARSEVPSMRGRARAA